MLYSVEVGQGIWVMRTYYDLTQAQADTLVAKLRLEGWKHIYIVPQDDSWSGV